MGSLHVDSLFSNIPSEEIIEIYTNELFKKSETVEYSVSLHIQFKCGKMQIRITPNTDTFYAVLKQI